MEMGAIEKAIEWKNRGEVKPMTQEQQERKPSNTVEGD